MIQGSRSTRNRLPGTVLAAVVLLSVTSTADMSVAAVLVGAGRSNVDVAAASGESLHQWLTRLTNAAKQMRQVLTGDDVQPSVPVAFLPQGQIDAIDMGCEAGPILATHAAPPPPAPLRHALTNLPPPLA